jgi:hypothetical protein
MQNAKFFLQSSELGLPHPARLALHISIICMSTVQYVCQRVLGTVVIQTSLTYSLTVLKERLSKVVIFKDNPILSPNNPARQKYPYTSAP